MGSGTVDGSALPPEIAFLARHGVARATLAEAARIAERCGVSADAALIREGLLREDAFYRALARETGLPFLDELGVHAFARFPHAILTGVAPLASGQESAFAFAPRGGQIAQTIAQAARSPAGLAITTPGALRRDVIAARAVAVAAMAADGLPRASPHLSYRDGMTVGQLWGMLAASFALGVASAAWPGRRSRPPAWRSASCSCPA